ncbi:MAG: TraB/GumN family protein [Pseudomonadota bacterium]
MRLLYLLIFMLSAVTLFAEESTHPISACGEYLETSSVDVTKINTTTPFKKGLLWQAEKDGKTNYVLGTIHSQDYLVTGFPPPIRLALVRSKLLLMETVPSDKANQAFFDAMYFQDGQTLSSYLQAEMLDELSRIAVEYGVPEDKVASLKPWAAFSLIGRPKPVRAASQEMNLLKLGMQTIQRIESLETMEEIVAALEGLSISDQITILEDTICNHSNIIGDAKKLIDLYVARDLEGILAFNQQPHHDEAVFERFMQAILYDRNDRVMNRIMRAFEEGNAFVAIGASHLADENGLLVQLQQAGFKLKSIY